MVEQVGEEFHKGFMLSIFNEILIVDLVWTSIFIYPFAMSCLKKTDL